MTPELALKIKARHREQCERMGWKFSEDRDPSGVYFVRWGAYIKIGCAERVIARVRAIWNSFPEGDLEPLGYVPVPHGSKHWHGAHEVKIHALLAAYRVRGEWFRDCLTIRRFIARHCAAWPSRQIGQK